MTTARKPGTGEHWLEDNPLRKWLSKNPLRVMIGDRAWVGGATFTVEVEKSAAEIGVSRAQVFEWLAARALPGTVNLMAIQRKFGIAADVYLKWWKSRPTGGQRNGSSTRKSRNPRPTR